MAEKKQVVEKAAPAPEEKKGGVRFSLAVPARVEEIVGRTGSAPQCARSRAGR